MQTPDPYAGVFSELRYAILARLAVSPATLPVLLRDLARAAEEGLIPGGFTVADVVGEVKLYTRLGIIASVDGVLRLRGGLPAGVSEKVSKLAEEMRAVLYREKSLVEGLGVSGEALAEA